MFVPPLDYEPLKGRDHIFLCAPLYPLYKVIVPESLGCLDSDEAKLPLTVACKHKCSVKVTE